LVKDRRRRRSGRRGLVSMMSERVLEIRCDVVFVDTESVLEEGRGFDRVCLVGLIMRADMAVEVN
jgi:hypothetical protein